MGSCFNTCLTYSTLTSDFVRVHVGVRVCYLYVTSTKKFCNVINRYLNAIHVCFQTECKPFRSCKAKVTSDCLAPYLYSVLCALITVSSLGFHGDDFCEIFVLWTMVWFIIGDTCFCFLQWILIWIRWSDCDRTQAKQRCSSWCSSSLGDLQEVHTRAADV